MDYFGGKAVLTWGCDFMVFSNFSNSLVYGGFLAVTVFHWMLLSIAEDVALPLQTALVFPLVHLDS